MTKQLQMKVNNKDLPNVIFDTAKKILSNQPSMFMKKSFIFGLWGLAINRSKTTASSDCLVSN